MSQFVFDVQGMTCQHCVKSVTNAVSSVPGVTQVEVTLATGKVEVTADAAVTAEQIANSIEEQGFNVVNAI